MTRVIRDDNWQNDRKIMIQLKREELVAFVAHSIPLSNIITLSFSIIIHHSIQFKTFPSFLCFYLCFVTYCSIAWFDLSDL